MAIQLAPPPLKTQLVDGDGLMTKQFYEWFLSITTRVASSAAAVTTAALSSQTASLPLTTLQIAAPSGLYRVSWYLRIVVAASVSSSIQFAVAYLDGGLALQQTGPAETGNTTATVQSGSFVLKSDPASPIAFATTYASVGVPDMSYDLSVVLEQMG